MTLRRRADTNRTITNVTRSFRGCWQPRSCAPNRRSPIGESFRTGNHDARPRISQFGDPSVLNAPARASLGQCRYRFGNAGRSCDSLAPVLSITDFVTKSDIVKVIVPTRAAHAFRLSVTEFYFAVRTISQALPAVNAVKLVIGHELVFPLAGVLLRRADLAIPPRVMLVRNSLHWPTRIWTLLDSRLYSATAVKAFVDWAEFVLAKSVAQEYLRLVFCGTVCLE